MVNTKFPDMNRLRAGKWVTALPQLNQGAPPIAYFEELGADGYRLASESREAEELGMNDLLKGVADHFSGVRVALNRISDRHFWPQGGDPVGRLLREVAGQLAG